MATINILTLLLSAWHVIVARLPVFYPQVFHVQVIRTGYCALIVNGAFRKLDYLISIQVFFLLMTTERVD